MAFVNLFQAIYPIGSVYLSTVSTSPSSTIGGTWVAMTGGMLGLAGSTGVAGAASNGGSRKISSNQMPSHTHGFTTYFWRDASTNFNQQQLLVAHTDETSSTSVSKNSEYKTAATGGVRIIFPHTPQFMVGEEQLNKVGEC